MTKTNTKNSLGITLQRGELVRYHIRQNGRIVTTMHIYCQHNGTVDFYAVNGEFEEIFRHGFFESCFN